MNTTKVLGFFLVFLMVSAAGCRDSEHDPSEHDLGIPRQRVDADLVLQSGGAVAWTLCATLANWERKPLEAMRQSVFRDPQYGNGRNPYPYNYALYLSSVFYVPFPTRPGLSPGTDSLKRIDDLGGLNWPKVNGQYDKRCGAGSGYVLPDRFEVLKVAGLHVLDMKRDGPNLVALVTYAPQQWEEIFIQLSSVNGGKAVPEFETITAVDPTGSLLYEERLARPSGGYQQTSYNEGGRFRSAVIAGTTPLVSAPVSISSPAETLHLYAGEVPGPINEGEIVAMDETGKEVAREKWKKTSELWAPLVSLNLPAGNYTFRFEIPPLSSATRRPGGNFLLLPGGVPTPID